MSPNVGVNVIEVDGLGSPAIQAAPTSVAAFVGLTERGIPDQPVQVSTLGQFQDRFGAYRPDGYLAYALEGFFINGGQVAYIDRVVGAGSAAAVARLANRQTSPAGPALLVAAGYRGQEDPGPWGDRIRIDVKDDPVASTQLAASTAANATTAQLVSVNGVTVGSVLHLVDGSNEAYRKVTTLDPATSTVGWADAISPALQQASTVVTTAEFRLTIRYQATASDPIAVVEDWRNLSMEADSPNYAAARIDHPFTGSKYVTVADLSGTAPPGLKNPAVKSSVALEGGSESPAGSADYAGDAGKHTGLFALDTTQVQLLAIPDMHTLPDQARAAVLQAALDYSAGRGDCMVVASAPDRGVRSGVTTPRALGDYTELESDYLTSLETFSATFQASKVYGALYALFIRVIDPIAPGPAPARFVPADGHVMGVYAQTAIERGIWKAPAGLSAQVMGALDVSATFTDAQHTDLVRSGLVNGIRRESGAGIVIAASRTLSTDTRWWFVNVRLLFNFVKSSLRDGLRFVRQEPHTDELRRRVKFNVVTPFLLGLWRQGAFGSDPPAAVFSVKCDAENNPPDQVDLGYFTIEVYFYPVKPAETVLIIVGQQPSGGSASEA